MSGNGNDDASAASVQENVSSRSAQQPSLFAVYGNNAADGNLPEAPPLCDAILEDHAFIKEDLPKAAILTLTGQFVTVVIMRTPYSRVQLRVQVSEYVSDPTHAFPFLLAPYAPRSDWFFYVLFAVLTPSQECNSCESLFTKIIFLSLSCLTNDCDYDNYFLPCCASSHLSRYTSSAIQYLEKYPFEAPLVELSSPSLPAPLLRNKEKECVEKAKNYLGQPQVKHIYEVQSISSPHFKPH
jgi:hypothetical protein